MRASLSSLTPFLESVVDRLNIGIFIVNSRMEIALWNHFMEVNSGHSAESVMGRCLFDCFPDLPRAEMADKLQSVFVLKNFAFSSWEQCPYLFKFRHNRPVTGGVEHMYQDYTFIPVKNGGEEVEYVCVTLMDVTDTAIYQKKLKEALRSLAEANNRDGLTALYNRNFLEEAIAKEFSRVRRYGGTLSLIMLDIDHFRIINDTYGHPAGDEVLCITAQYLGRALRQADTLGRYGGEEFVLLLPETNLDGAHILADRIRQEFAESPIRCGETAIEASLSAGVAEYHGGMMRYEDLIKDADFALRRAKQAGRNRVRCAVQQDDATFKDARI